MQGGLGGEPGNEAHGGYTYCGVAALALLGRLDALDVAAVAAAASQRQAWLEGGFSGRSNKLADGCYSFWQGALFPLLRHCRPVSVQAPSCATHMQKFAFRICSTPCVCCLPIALCTGATQLRRQVSGEPWTAAGTFWGRGANVYAGVGAAYEPSVPALPDALRTPPTLCERSAANTELSAECREHNRHVRLSH